VAITADRAFFGRGRHLPAARAGFRSRTPTNGAKGVQGLLRITFGKAARWRVLQQATTRSLNVMGHQPRALGLPNGIGVNLVPALLVSILKAQARGWVAQRNEGFIWPIPWAPFTPPPHRQVAAHGLPGNRKIPNMPQAGGLREICPAQQRVISKKSVKARDPAHGTRHSSGLVHDCPPRPQFSTHGTDIPGE